MQLEIHPEQEAKLNDLANLTGRAKEDIVSEAVDRFYEYQAWFHEQVEEGRAQLRRGEYVTHEEVRRRMEKRFGR